ncbi:MAG: hypothetical protein ACQEXV_22365 [Bacillota bacterium]
MAAKKNSQSKTYSVSSQNTVAEAIMALRNVIKKEYDLNVDVDVSIYGWLTTLHLAKLTVKDMVAGIEGWETRHREIPSPPG